MANEVQHEAMTALNYYFQRRRVIAGVLSYWNTVGQVFEAYNAANWADYDHPTSEAGNPPGQFSGNASGGTPGRERLVFYERLGGAPASTDQILGGQTLYWDGSAYHLADGPVFHAEVNFTRDQSNQSDEYTVQWFKDGVPVIAGITLPTIQVVKRADGTNLVASSAMTQVGATGAYKFTTNVSGERQTKGEAAIVLVGATIESAVRTWRRIPSRDSG